MTLSQEINTCSTIANDRGRENSVFCHSLHPHFQHWVEWVPAVKTHALSFPPVCSWKQICSSMLLPSENIHQLLQSVKVGCQLSCFAASPWASPVCSLGFRCASPSPSITYKKRTSDQPENKEVLLPEPQLFLHQSQKQRKKKLKSCTRQETLY